MCQSNTTQDRPDRSSHQHEEAVGPSLLDRRVILKASALLPGLIAGGLSMTRRPDTALAQSAVGITDADTYEASELTAQAAGQAVTFQASFPFTAVGAHWSGNVSFPVRIDMAFSADGETWTDPVSVTASADRGRVPTDGGTYADLVFCDRSNYVRYYAADGDGNPAQVEGLKFTYLNSDEGPASYDDPPNDLSAAAISKPRVIPRSQWGADERLRFDKNGEIWPPEYQPVEHVIIHHTATPNFQDPFAAIRSIYYYHTVTQGWGDIGYNYLVDYNGNIYEGRYGGENVAGGHAYQYNYGSCGIAVMGDFAFQDITSSTQSALVAITSYAARNLNPYGVSTFHQVPNLPTICAHRDVIQTTCPGDYLYADMQTIRNYAASIISGQQTTGLGVGDQVTVSVIGGNLRSGPSMRAKTIASMAFGTVLTITGSKQADVNFTMYPVSGPYGSGWVASTIIAPVGSGSTSNFSVGSAIFVNTDLLFLRNGPSTSSQVITTLASSTRGVIIGGPSSGSGYTWWQIQTDSYTGWAAQDYLRLVSSSTADSFQVGNNVVVDSDALNLRASPGTNGQILATVTNGTQMTLIEGPYPLRPYIWWKCRTTTGVVGWAAQDFLTLGGNGAPAPAVYATTRTAVDMHSNPSSSAAVIGSLPSGVQVQVTDGPQSAESKTWYGVYRQGYGGGWVPSTTLNMGGTSTPPPTSGGFTVNQQVRITDASVNYRSGPGLGYGIRNVLPAGTVLTVTAAATNADGYTWYPLTNSQYGAGYTVSDYLTAV